MPDEFSRPLSQIDCDIRNLLTLNLDAQQRLGYIARLREQMDIEEYNLVCANEGRRSKIDRLLDERLRSVATDQMPSGVM